MRDRLTALGVAFALAAALGLSAVGRADACSCAMLSEAEQLAAADVAFVGVTAAIDGDQPIDGAFDGTGEIVATFVVEETLKGSPERTMRIRTANNGAACGAGFGLGQRWKVLAYAADRGFASNLCSGTTLLAASAPIPALGTSPDDAPSGLPAGVILAGGALAVIAIASALAFTRRGRASA